MNPPFSTENLAKQVTVKSAVNPSLWACVVISVPMFILSAYTDGIKSLLFFGVALLPLVTFIGSYIYFLIKSPEYLRSEEYQLKAQSLRLLGDKDSNLDPGARDIVAITTNPSAADGAVDQSDTALDPNFEK